MFLTSQIYKLWEFPDLFSANFKLLGLRRQAGALTATQICRLPLNFSVCLWANPPPRNLGVLANTLKSKRGQCFRHGQRPVQNFNVSLFILRCLRTFYFSSENTHCPFWSCSINIFLHFSNLEMEVQCSTKGLGDTFQKIYDNIRWSTGSGHWRSRAAKAWAMGKKKGKNGTPCTTENPHWG